MGNKYIVGDLYVNDSKVVTEDTLTVPTKVSAFENDSKYVTEDTINGKYSEGLTYTLKDNDEYEVKGIGTCTDTHISIPSIYNEKRVTSIGSSAFNNCSNLTNITIPDSVTSLDKRAFGGCTGLTSIAIPDSVTSIGNNAFSGCNNLKDFTMSKNIVSIGANVFNYCNMLEKIIIPNSVTNIESNAFQYCPRLTICCEAESQPEGWDETWNSSNRPVVWGTSLDFASINEKLNNINDKVDGLIGPYSEGLAYTLKTGGTYEVSGIGTCTDTDIIVPFSIDGKRVTNIGTNAFLHCTELTSIIIPNSITTIGSQAFFGCTQLINVTIPDSVTIIGGWAFNKCSNLANITIPDSVTSIDHGTFQYCSDLANITIPDSVTSIGSNAFLNCNNLTIYCEAESQPEGWDANWNPSNRPVVWGADVGRMAESLNNKELFLYSSTAGSTKKFKITVDDSGTIIATEVV